MKMASQYLNKIGMSEFKKDRKDKKVVFTNGCFDLLHYGHLTLLNDAKSFGDILVIGLNSDTSIQKLKGESRPILNESIRRNTLFVLPMVDYIFTFNELTPITLIESISPDILVKGKHWEGKIVGEDFVKDNGGEVKTIHIVDGISTTDIISRCYDSINSP